MWYHIPSNSCWIWSWLCRNAKCTILDSFAHGTSRLQLVFYFRPLLDDLLKSVGEKWWILSKRRELVAAASPLSEDTGYSDRGRGGWVEETGSFQTRGETVLPIRGLNRYKGCRPFCLRLPLGLPFSPITETHWLSFWLIRKGQSSQGPVWPGKKNSSVFKIIQLQVSTCLFQTWCYCLNSDCYTETHFKIEA